MRHTTPHGGRASLRAILLSCTLLLCLRAQLTTSLASTAPATDSPPIKRVAIIGTGIAGLSLAQALVNSPNLASMGGPPIEVSLFDSRPSLDFGAGAGIQINGGMSALHKINPAVHKAVANAGLPMKKIQSRAKPWFDKDRPYDQLLQLDLEKAVKEAGGETEEELIIDGQLNFYSIMRGALQKALMETLPPDTAKRVEFSKTLTGIRASENGGITCEFKDGSAAGDFDMVVGCDGIKSAVKDYIETGKISEDVTRDGRAAIYSGIRIRYAVQDGDPSSPAPPEGVLTQYFGDGTYAVSGVYGAGAGRPPIKSAFLVFLDKDYIGPFKKKEAPTSDSALENADWTQNIRASGDAASVMLEQVKECGVPDIDIGPVIANADRFFELGVYFHSPVSCSGWSKEVKGSGGRFCTLAGDAAHAMPPFLGQGSNQAIQDAYCLAKKIYEHNARVTMDYRSPTGVEDPNGGAKDIKALLKEYEQTRWAPTASISLKAGLLGYLEAGGGFISKFRDAFFVTTGKVGIAKKVFLGAATPRV